MNLYVFTKVFPRITQICCKHLEEICWESLLQSKSLNINLLKLASAKTDSVLEIVRITLNCSVRSALGINHPLPT